MRDPTRLGDLAELEVTVAFVRAGRRVLGSLSSGCRYHLVVDEGDGQFTRIKRKSGVLHGGRITFRTSSMSARGASRTYRGDVDAFGIYCSDTDEAYHVIMAAIQNVRHDGLTARHAKREWATLRRLARWRLPDRRLSLSRPASNVSNMRSIAVALIAVIVACVPSTPTPASSLAPIVLGQRAVRPVPAFGSVWIASAAEGTVQRVDPTTGTIVATIKVADPQRLLAAGCAPSSEHAYATGSFGLRACDAPSAVAAGGGAIWAVANDASAIVRVDPATDAITDTIALGFAAWSVTATDDAVWVSDYANDAVVRVDPRTRTVVARIPVPSWPTEIATSDDAVWVVCSAAGRVARIDATRNAVATTIGVGAWALAIAVAGDDVWVRGGAVRADGGLYRIDARTNAVALVVQAGAPEGREGVSSIAATDRGVWLPGVSLDLLDRVTGGIVTTLPISSYAVALDGRTLWVLDVFGRLVRRTVSR